MSCCNGGPPPARPLACLLARMLSATENVMSIIVYLCCAHFGSKADDVGMHLIVLLDCAIIGPTTTKFFWTSMKEHCQVIAEGYQTVCERLIRQLSFGPTNHSTTSTVHSILRVAPTNCSFDQVYVKPTKATLRLILSLLERQQQISKHPLRKSPQVLLAP